MAKKTVLIVGPTPPPMGGIATYVQDLLISDINEKYHIIHMDTARSHSIKKSITKNFLLFLKNEFKLLYIFIVSRPKVVHIHTSSYLAFWEKSIFLMTSKLFLKKIIMHVHGAEFDLFYVNNNFFGKYLIRKILDLSDSVIVLSLHWQAFFLGILNAKKIHVIPNAINNSKFANRKNSFLQDDKCIQLLFLGNLVARKGIYDILFSIQLLKDKLIQNVNFVFAGSEEYPGEIDRLKNECSKLGVEKFVTFISNFTDEEKVRLLAKSDIYLLPSYAEGLPISLLEAMAAGLPVISTYVGGIPEVVENEINGFLITPGDYVRLANIIIELVENPELRKAISLNNQEKVRTKYDWKIVGNDICNVYNELLGYQNNF